MKKPLTKKLIDLLFALLVVSSVVSCGDSPFLSDEKPSDQISGVSGISNQASKIILDGLEVIPCYTEKVKLYENNSLNLIFMNEYGELVDPTYKISLMLWVPDHGHGSFSIEITN